MNDEYISKEDIIRQICLTTGCSYHGPVVRTIIGFPAADVQPIARSMWIDCTFYDPCERNWERDFEYKCNNCGHKIHNKPNDDNLFCGHCGARMDLNEGNDERNF